MRAGKLRHVITIQTLTETVNTLGERTESWPTATTRRGSIVPIGGTENEGSRQTEADATHLVTMRNYALSTKTNRLSWDSRTFGILSVSHTDNRDIDTLAAVVEIK